ncbi:MAG: hypothetical protein ABSH42_03145 [Bryobacteraceae bacterium]|jgi:hypothetical protein
MPFEWLRAIMPQIVHCPAVFDDEERYPFGDVLSREDPDPENQGERFYDPKDRVEGLFVAGFCFVVGDVSEKLPHEVWSGRGDLNARPPAPKAISGPGRKWPILNSLTFNQMAPAC